MSERSGDLGEVRSLMQRAPGEAVWRALVEALATLDVVTLTEQVVPYDATQLTRWPDALRVAPASLDEARDARQ